MATVSKWTPFGVALDLTATGGTVTRTSATQYTVKINVSWETYYSGAQTNYGMTATSGGVTHTISKFDGTKRSSGSGSFTGTYSISGNSSATKTITVTFKNFNTDNGDTASKNVTFNVTVPAWTSYTIKYNANGGSGAPGSQTKWKDQTLKLSTTKPTRTGYSFLGWSTSSSATSATYAAGANYTANAAATLYAVWKANTYTVSYNANGGSGAPASQTKTYGQTLTLSSTKPTRTNYNFKGWGTSASSTTVSYASGASYTANAAITLYAIWELAYTKPRITNLSIVRVDSSDVLSDSGTTARVAFSWACDKTVSSITIQWKLATASSYGNSKTVTASGTSGTVHQLISTFSTESSYDIRITVADSSGSSYVAGVLPSMKFILDFLAGGNGAAVGKAAEQSGVFDIGFKTRFFGGLLYPVIEPDTDLNNVMVPNTYAGENASTYNYGHCPISSGTFTLEVMSAGPNGQLLQRLTVCDKTKAAVYERFYYTNAWGDWTGGWIYPTLGSDFVMYGSDEAANKPRYRKDGRMVEVRGIVKPAVNLPKDGDGSTTSYTIFTLPAGYRPNSPIYVICQGSGNCTWMLQVNSNGNVTFARYRNGDASTTAAVGAWLPFQVTFLAN
jgi:uncharacterized repeat protein (TIGR02543 family)